ncbi:MAG TPA: cache domain-containing protein [Spirochaetota bacterium]|nr:cache domain-containing protein [Spirochaetota bacterium]HOR44374.1 cache domain-containing protein [Spirochaetota bacterium]HPK55853.1 cache domain-containing protein [Spirochaetota bacterium]HQE58998.1 cache domain-containing protein [Spirochaetota bacterium]
MKSRQISLRLKIILVGVLISIVPLVTTAAIIFRNSSKAMEEISKTQNIQIAKSLSSMVETAINKDLNVLKKTAEDPNMHNLVIKKKYNEISKILSDLDKIIGTDYEGITMVDSEGIIRADGVDPARIGLSLSSREYFQEAKKGKVAIGSVKFSLVSGYPVFGICAPILSERGEFLGGIVGVVKADYLLRYISSLELGKTGFGFMIDRNGIIIAHPEKRFILKIDTLKENKDVRGISKRMINKETGTGEYFFNGARKLVGFTPVHIAGWSIGVTQTKHEVMTLAYSNRNLILIVTGISLFISGLLLLFLSGKISSPVQNILATLNQAINQAADAIFIINPDRKISFANPAASEISGESANDLKDSVFDLKNSDIETDEIWEKLKSGGTWNSVIHGTKKDSSSYTINLKVTPVRDDSQKINAYLAIAGDRTKEVAMENQLRQSQKMEAIGTLAGGIAHDFNNILGAIFGYIELSLSSLDNKEEIKSYLQETISAAERAKDLINHILVFSRQMEHAKQPIRPKDVIEDALKLIRASLPSTIEIHKKLNSESSILADKTQLHQIMMNLCTNAGYAMKDKGGSLEISLDDIEITSATQFGCEPLQEGKHIEIKITDTGNGIPDVTIDRIFEPFFTTKPQGEGTGLGLSVVHGIIRSLKGVICVKSKEGKGTVFSIYIPTVEENMEKEDFTDETGLFRGTGNILLIDDEENLVRTGSSLLKNFGYSAFGFSDPEKALSLFREKPLFFDAVISDYTMPRYTGFDLAEIIRNIRPEIPFILCSGYIDTDVETKMKALKIDSFLKKPLSGRKMAQTLYSVLSK